MSEPNERDKAGAANEPAAMLLGAFIAVLQGKMNPEEAISLAGQPALAAAATPEGVRALGGTLEQAREQLPGKAAHLLAAMLASHASALDDLRRMDLSLELYAHVLPVLEALGAPSEIASWRMNAAIALDNAGRREEAMAGYKEALALFQRHGRPVDVARCLVNLANSLHSLGRFEEAVAGYKEALPLFRSHGRPDEVATCLMNLANSLNGMGRYEEAVEGYKAALALFQRHGRPVDVAGCLMNLALALNGLGRREEAVAGYKEALPLFRSHGRPVDVAGCLMNLAIALNGLGRREEAMAGYKEALPLFQSHGSPDQVALCLMNLAIALNGLGWREEAMAGYKEALPLFQRHGRPVDVARCLVNLANSLHSLGRFEEAVAGYNEALALFRSHGSPDQDALCLMNLANSLNGMGRPEEAIRRYSDQPPASLPVYDQIGYHGGFAYALVNSGQPRQALQQFTLCRRAMRQTRFLSGIDETDLQFIPTLLGYLRFAVRGALDQKENLLAFDTVQDGKACLFADLRDRFGNAPWGDAAGGDGPRRLLVQALRAGEPIEEPLRSYQHLIRQTLRDGEAAQTQQLLPAAADPADTLARIRATLPLRWAILDFWQLDEQELAIFVVTHDDLHVIRIRPFETVPELLPQMDLYWQFIHNLDKCLDQKRRPSGWQAADTDQLWDNLHEAIFAPLMKHLRDIDGLYLVPHTAWHLVPLHAARWFDPVACKQTYLCDRFQVAYLPSAALLPDLPKVQLDGDILSLANPDRGHKERTLPFAEWEADQLQAIAQADPRHFHAGPDATADKTADWHFASVLHFSCHGAGHPQFASLARLALHDDPLLAHDVAYRRPPLREGAMVILNGCETAVRDQRAPDEGMGLMTSFLLRGAGLVLASQWSVHDHCAAELVSGFAEQMLRHHAAPAIALQHAQRQVRELTGEQTQKRCDELLQTKFPATTHPHEAKKLHATGWRAAVRSGRFDLARRHAEGLAGTLRCLGEHHEADRLETALRLGRTDTPASAEERYGEEYKHEVGYDDPFYWAAFQIVGRIA